MARIAVLYDTSEGQTARIAGDVARIVSETGHQVTLEDVRRLPSDFHVESFDGVVLGASIHVGKHSRQVADFVRRNRSALDRLSTAFFSVSLSAAGKTDRQQANARRCLDDFLRETNWTPAVSTTLAGALLYRQYGFFKRLVMKWIAASEGGDTDTSRNYEYTDWEQVRRFTEQFLDLVRESPTATSDR